MFSELISARISYILKAVLISRKGVSFGFYTTRFASGIPCLCGADTCITSYNACFRLYDVCPWSQYQWLLKKKLIQRLKIIIQLYSNIKIEEAKKQPQTSRNNSILKTAVCKFYTLDFFIILLHALTDLYLNITGKCSSRLPKNNTELSSKNRCNQHETKLLNISRKS